MKKIRFIVKYTLLTGVFLLSCRTGNHSTGLSKEEATALAREAYLFLTPLIYTDVTRVASPLPDNRLHVFDGFPDHTFRQVVAPNNDTNYAIAFLDLSEEAVVIEWPDTKGRYYVFPLQDAWTNNFFLPGKRTTGTEAQKYLVTPPGWTGEVPGGLTQVKSPTTLVWAIGRVQVNSPEDLRDFVLPLQRQIVLQPLSAWLEESDPADPQPPHRLYFPPGEAQGKPVVEVVRSLPVEDFFNYANALLADNPPAEADSVIVRRMAAIGVGAGLRFSLSAFDPQTQEVLKQVPADVYAELEKPVKEGYFGKVTFDPAAKLGDYHTDYNTRALVAYRGLGALPPEEAVYYSYYTDADGEPLKGQNRYRIHFGKGQLPPAQSFWSYTVYGPDRYLVENPLRRYALGDRDALQYNADGSLDLYLSRESPGKNRESNWLPTGDSAFNLTLRIYTPTEAFLNDRSVWNDPKPEIVE
ncbi:MAG: DUF1254 domain-containing protein [Tannerella sp.]|jgi:hypothetical protein|nr:DUF1254 domain-containing protein [Tannerella sp.]